jgi:type I restriction enzyme, S subunit
MSSQHFRDQLASRKGETDMADYVSLTAQRELKVPVPPITLQRAIAATLGVLRDKIEVNRRMNETLEQIARAIFKSWFIDFDPIRAKIEGRDTRLTPDIAALFPDRFIETENGEMPEGWRQANFASLVEPISDVVKAEEFSPEEPYIGLEHMPRRSITLGYWGATEELASHKARFRQGDILFGKLRPYFHKVGRALVNGICSTDIVVLRPTATHCGALALFVASSDAFVAFNDVASTGTKMPRTSWGRMREYPIALPTAEAASAFQHLAAPMLDRIHLNVFESRSLAALRDLLLPKLMSGKIRVRDAERLVGEAGT